MIPFEFTTTGCNRPEVYSRTLISFRDNLTGVDWEKSTMYLNIDSIPKSTGKEHAYRMERVAGALFKRVHVRYTGMPSFPAAVKWCWTRPANEFFFHLEDDWLLTTKINIEDMLRMLMDNPRLSCVNLRAYEGIRDERICLSPCVMRTAHAKVMAERLRDDVNPEQQLRLITPNNPHGGAHHGFIGARYPEQVVLQDIGREWLAKSKFKKEVDVRFTKWVTR